MIRRLLLTSAALALATTAQPVLAAPAKAKPVASATLAASNPFAKPSTLPFQAPISRGSRIAIISPRCSPVWPSRRRK